MGASLTTESGRAEGAGGLAALARRGRPSPAGGPAGGPNQGRKEEKREKKALSLSLSLVGRPRFSSLCSALRSLSLGSTSASLSLARSARSARSSRSLARSLVHSFVRSLVRLPISVLSFSFFFLSFGRAKYLLSLPPLASPLAPALATTTPSPLSLARLAARRSREPPLQPSSGPGRWLAE